jgi:hypothetical protein
LRHLVREDKTGVPVQLANLLTGYRTQEELIRSASYSHWLHQEFGLPFDYANITYVPAYTWSYPPLLHAMGIKYFAAAANNDRASALLYGRWNEKSPFWWQGPDGAKVLIAYTAMPAIFEMKLGRLSGIPRYVLSRGHPRCIGVPPSRNQNRPRMGRGDRDVARVRGAPHARMCSCSAAPVSRIRGSSTRKTTNLNRRSQPSVQEREPEEDGQTANAAVCAASSPRARSKNGSKGAGVQKAQCAPT